MHRFYCPKIDFSPPKIKIQNPGEIHHLKNVLRMDKGDELELFNGQGDEVVGVIESIGVLEVIVAIVQRRPMGQASLSIILACAVPKKAKFETIVEKCTELGVDHIIPLRTVRTEVVWKEDKGGRKNTRYQTIAVNASKQSARITVPVIDEQKPLKDVILLREKKTLGLIPCLFGNRKLLKDVINGAEGTYDKVLILIGPEGDFTPQEVKAALEAGFIPVSLGENTLKVDTAAMAVVSYIRQTVCVDKRKSNETRD